VIFAAVLVLGLIKPSLMSVSPYCKSLPLNAVNIVSLSQDSDGCPHWYIEVKSVLKNCFCLIGGYVICEGDEDYASVFEGCSGALPPGCPVCPIYRFTPIADYGGLLEGYNCVKDVTQLCTDGTTIILKQCVDGLYVSTGNNCPNPNPEPTPEPEPVPIGLLIGVIVWLALMVVIGVFVARRFIKK